MGFKIYISSYTILLFREFKYKSLRLALVKKHKTKTVKVHVELFLIWCGNDPSAGSPTETLLRLHLPLNDEV